MEKKLRSELLELCQSIIEDNREEDLVSTLTQTQMLYEKLVVLNYLKEQEDTFEVEGNVVEENIPIQESISHLSIEKSPKEEVSPEATPESEITQEKMEPKIPDLKMETPEKPLSETESSTGTNRSINDQMATGLLKIGLNDRIAFVKHLFNGEQQDYNRVLSNLNTMANFDEADSFVNQMIRPEYNWEGKEEYIERLMDLVRQKFGIES